MKKTVKMTLTAMFFALGILLPFLTGQIPAVGKMLLPMHLPVLLCGLLVGWQYGAVAGFLLPLVRSALFGMPPLLPTGLAMAFELAAYGLISGWLAQNKRLDQTKNIYFALVLAMLGGRVVWALARLALLGVSGGSFTFAMFVAGAFTSAILGIVLQLILIPAIVLALYRAGVLPADKAEIRS